MRPPNWRSSACSWPCSPAGSGCWPRSCQSATGSLRRTAGWFTPAVVGGAFTLHPLFMAVPWAACFVLGLLDWRAARGGRSIWTCWRWPVLLPGGDAAQRRPLPGRALWLAAVCLGWLLAATAGAALGLWRMPELRPSVGSPAAGRSDTDAAPHPDRKRRGGNIADVAWQASLLGAWRILHGLPLYGAVSWQGPGGLEIYRLDSYGPFAYYAYIHPIRGLPSRQRRR